MTASRAVVPYPSLFATEATTKAALERLRRILAGRAAAAGDLRLLIGGLVINPEMFPRIDGQTSFEAYGTYIQLLTERLLAASTQQAVAGVRALGMALRYELLLGWLSLDKQAAHHHAIPILRRLAGRRALRGAIVKELADTVLCADPLVPIDVRGEAGDALLDLLVPADGAALVSRLRPLLAHFSPLPLKELRAHVLVGTDTIDTPFHFPASLASRLRLIRKSAAMKTRERVFVDAMRIAERLGEGDKRFATLHARYAPLRARITEITSEYLSHPEGEAFIRARLSSRLRRVEDYIVHPNQMLGTHTVSDLTRIFSLAPESYWPDGTVRSVWTAFARAVLGFSRAASIGLGSRMIYIPHGVDTASLVYVGQAVVIGRGANLDLTAGLLIGRRNYLSAFWSDCDLHGHLHVGDSQLGVGGTLSRLAIEPYVMMLDDDIAFPPGSGFIEAAHYAPGRPLEGTIPGFRVVPATPKPLVAGSI